MTDRAPPTPASLLARVRARLGGPGMDAVVVRGATGSAGAHVLGAVLALLAQLGLAHFCRLGFQIGLIRFTASYRTTGDGAIVRDLLLRAPLLGLSAALVTGGGCAGVSRGFPGCSANGSGGAGARLTGAYPALIVLLIDQVVNAPCNSVGYLMTMTGQQDRALVALLGGAMANLALNALLVPRFELMAAAGGAAASTAFWNLWMLVEKVWCHRLNPSVFVR